MSDELARLGIDRPRISSVITPVVLDENRVHFRAGPWTGPNLTVADDDEDGILADLIRTLDGTASVDELLDQFDSHREAVSGLLGQLQENNIIVEGPAAGGSQHGLNVHRESMNEGEFHDRVGSNETAVLADGAVGEHVIEALLDAGIGRVSVVDASDAGDVSVPDSDRVVQCEELEPVVDEFDAVFACTSTGDTARLRAINDLAHEYGTSVVYGQVVGYDGIVGPTVVPTETACFECLERRVTNGIDDAEAYGAFKETVGNRRSGSVATPFAQIVAGYASLDLLTLLVGEPPALSNTIAALDFVGFAFQPNTVLKAPNCRTCGVGFEASVDWERFASTLQFGERGDR